MADVFISYSSKDRAHAEQLTELLTSAGLSCWIDKQEIDVATSWSGEIVNAIDSCKALVVLLSSTSIESKNVLREVALAFEKNKKILPLDLEPVVLSRDLQYHLAGIQRASVSNIDTVIRALGKLGLEATKAPEIKLVTETDSRKSLMVIPFEDLSPTADNEWFANGIVSELINVLSKARSLKVTDAQTTKEFKVYKGHLTVYAKEMGIRYFVQGDVRKFGDQIKVSCRLLDIETGDHLWMHSMKGTMENIFEIQEKVAEHVFEGLKLHLTAEEQADVSQKMTHNAEAYELYLKGREYFNRQTKADYDRALILFESALALDPSFAAVYLSLAQVHESIYASYDRAPSHLERSSVAAKRVRELEGESAGYCWIMSLISRRRGDANLALEYAKRGVEIDPTYAGNYDMLGSAYEVLDNKAGMIEAREKYVRLRPDYKAAHSNLLYALRLVGDTQQLQVCAQRAIPIFERVVRLNPDDLNTQVLLACTYKDAGDVVAAFHLADILAHNELLDAVSLYNLACLYIENGQHETALRLLQLSVRKGLVLLEFFLHDADLDPIRDLPEFNALVQELKMKVEGRIS